MGRHVCLLTTAAFSIHSAGCGTVRGRSLAAPCLAVQLLVTAGGVLRHRVHGAAVAGAAALWRLWPRGGKQRPVEERCNQRCAGGGEGEEDPSEGGAFPSRVPFRLQKIPVKSTIFCQGLPKII